MCVPVVKGLDGIKDSDKLDSRRWSGLSGPKMMEL